MIDYHTTYRKAFVMQKRLRSIVSCGTTNRISVWIEETGGDEDYYQEEIEYTIEASLYMPKGNISTTHKVQAEYIDDWTPEQWQEFEGAVVTEFTKCLEQG